MRPETLCTVLLLIILLGGGCDLRASPPEYTDRISAISDYQDRRYSAARAQFRSIEQRRGASDPEIDFYLGRLALWFDDEAEALMRLERAVRCSPQSARLHHALGDAYGLAAQRANLLAKLGWARKCLAAYERAVALDSSSIAARWSLLGYYLVAPRIAGGGTDKAIGQAAAIRELDDMSGRIALATIELAVGNHDPAFAQFDEILQTRPADFLALYHIGRCAALSGDQLERGRDALRRCLELFPPHGDGMPTRASVHHRLGNVLDKIGDKHGAELAYAAAIQTDPDFRPEKIALRN